MKDTSELNRLLITEINKLYTDKLKYSPIPDVYYIERDELEYITRVINILLYVYGDTPKGGAE